MIFFFDYTKFNNQSTRIDIVKKELSTELHCIQINYISVYRVDSLKVITIDEASKRQIDEFKFDKPSKIVSVDCFYNPEVIEKGVIVKVYSGGKEMDYRKNIK